MSGMYDVDKMDKMIVEKDQRKSREFQIIKIKYLLDNNKRIEDGIFVI
jgi:hypothetical protein